MNDSGQEVMLYDSQIRWLGDRAGCRSRGEFMCQHMSVSKRHMRVSQRDLDRISPILGFVMVFTHICGANGGTPQLLNY
jgi:hypothetical protein